MSIEKRLNNKSIVVPTHPFWEVFRTFGRDEIIAGLLAITATAILEFIFFSLNIPKTGNALLLLILAGPIVEKFGFFIGHINDARNVYKETPECQRKPLGHYCKNAFRGGLKSLIEDILIHDPLYIGLIYLGTFAHPQTPIWLLVPIAFGAAVVIVAFLEVMFVEHLYKKFKRKLIGKGFGSEIYNEARFFIPLNQINPERVIEQLREEFLPEEEAVCVDYHDRYYDNELPEYNARKAIVRLRERGRRDNTVVRTLQVVYTRAVEHSTSDDDQFRFFPQKKDKIYLEQDSVEDAGKFVEFNKLLKVDFSHPSRDISFKRHVVTSNDKIFISVDSIDDQDFAVIEIKAYIGREAMLKEAMRYVMHQFPVLQTTYNKFELVF